MQHHTGNGDILLSIFNN